MRCDTMAAVSVLITLCGTVDAETIIHAGRLIDGRGDNAAESPLEGIFQSAHSLALFAVI